MRKTFAAAAAALMLGAAAIASAPSASAQTIYVQPYGYGTYGQYGYDPYRNDPYRYGQYGSPYSSGSSEEQIASTLLGLALGAMSNGAANNGTTYQSQYYGAPRGRTTYEVVPDPYFTGDPRQIDLCARRYRSYDPYTNAFRGRDGRYYYCRL